MLEKGELPHLKTIVNFDGYDEAQLTRLALLYGINFTTYHDIHQAGTRSLTNWRLSHSSINDSKAAPVYIRRKLPAKDTQVLIIYSSGTTGVPKGTILTHKNMISGHTGALSGGYTFYETDKYLSWVPLSHIQEQTLLANCMVYGIQIGYPRFFADGKVGGALNP